MNNLIDTEQIRRAVKSEEVQVHSLLLYFIQPRVAWEEKKKRWEDRPRNKMRYSRST